jgi:hypothetical protein
MPAGYLTHAHGGRDSHNGVGRDRTGWREDDAVLGFQYREEAAEQYLGKPETFKFPGFVHCCGTVIKRVAAKLLDRMHASTKGTTERLQSAVRGYFRYHAVPHNEERLKTLRHEALSMWWWHLCRRSQRSRWTRKQQAQPARLLGKGVNRTLTFSQAGRSYAPAARKPAIQGVTSKRSMFGRPISRA